MILLKFASLVFIFFGILEAVGMTRVKHQESITYRTTAFNYKVTSVLRGADAIIQYSGYILMSDGSKLHVIWNAQGHCKCEGNAVSYYNLSTDELTNSLFA